MNGKQMEFSENKQNAAVTCEQTNWSVWTTENSDRTRISTTKANHGFDKVEAGYAGRGKIRGWSTTGSNVKQISERKWEGRRDTQKSLR
jgi:hypothetical protein